MIDALALSGSAAVDVVAKAASDPTIFFNLNASFEPARTPFDWLSRDPSQVDLYLADPWCGFALVPESFGSLLAQGPRLADPAELAKIPAELPIYVFSGDRDPLYGDLGAVEPLIARYKAAGLNVSTRIYKGARHEVLNETNRDEVVTDLLAWLGAAT
jgi:alpha-beta hydrolase superfamily lysophospholipase